jgi:tetratricopeptide (TPR) repeat protein
MRGKVHIGAVALCLGLFPVSEALAQHCQAYWTAQYKCAMGCGPCGGGGGGAPAPYIPPPPSPAEIAAQQARAINQNALSAEKAGNLALAISLYEQALRLSPTADIANNLAHARTEVIDKQAIEAERAGNSALALRLFEQALRALPADSYYEPSRVTLRKNIAQTRAHLEEQQGRERQQQQDKVAAANMEQSIKNLTQSLTTTTSTSGLDFNDGRTGSKPDVSGGLPFMAGKPAAADSPAKADNGAAPPAVFQFNPGAKYGKAPEVTVEGAKEAGSAREQLFNSRFESTGQLFDNGRAHDDAAVDAKLANVATPLAQAVEARFARNKDYQAAASELARTQAAADALNKKMADLVTQQSASPTPERQTEIYNLSGQVHQASGAVAIATTNLDTVKKKIIQEGPAIVVDDGAPAAAQPAAAGK